jgi:hypothetical protein
MTYSWPIYIVLAIVAAVSFGTALFLPTADILRWISGVPALVALIGVVLQIFRDNAQHEKALVIQRDQQHFILGVTSHMANVAFNKHVEFCEKYISQMQETLSTLFREGPTRSCLELSSKLAGIRLSFRTWLTSDIQDKILPFEGALTKIASKHIELEGLRVGDERTQVVEEMHNTFADVLGLSRLEGRGNNNEEIAARRIMDHLQTILGVKQLVQLRIALVDEAVKTLGRKNEQR